MTEPERIRARLKWLGMTQYEFAVTEHFPLPALRRALTRGVDAIPRELALRLYAALELEPPEEAAETEDGDGVEN